MRALTKRIRPGSAFWLWIAGLIVAVGAVSAASLNLNFVQVAMLPGTRSTSFPCGDPRHDGKICIFGNTTYVNGPESLVIFEHEGNNIFNRITYPGIGELVEFGYSDGESLGEIITAVGGSYVRIYRSLARDSFPTTCIFNESINDGSWSYAHFTDLDADGHQEMAYNKSAFGIWLFEYTHGTEFDSVAVLADNPPWGYYVHFDVGDFDLDGHRELVCGRPDSGDSGVVYIFEALGPDNQYALSAVCSTASFNNGAIAAAHDMDHNGWPEFLVWGQLQTHSGDSGRLAVYEASGHAHYKTVWEQRLPYCWFPNNYTISVGDVDGDGNEEFTITTGYDVRIFKCTDKATYQQVGVIPISALNVKLFDVNGDGRAEVVLDEGVFSDTALVFEDTEGLALDELARLPKPQVVNLPATIIRAGTSVSFPSLDRNAEVAIYDIRGRMITEHKSTAAEAWRWDLTDQHGRRVPAGTYFVLIRCQGQTASTKLCVVN